MIHSRNTHFEKTTRARERMTIDGELHTFRDRKPNKANKTKRGGANKYYWVNEAK